MKIPKYLNEVLTVDPGYNTGWAMWRGTAKPETGSFSVPKSVMGTPRRLHYLYKEFRAILYYCFPQRIVIEDQWFNEYSLTSLTSAKSGAMKKLTWVVGGYMISCQDIGVVPELILPMRWKGNMDDLAVKERVNLVTGIFYKNAHIADAVGIGLNEVDRFIKVKGIV